MGKQEYLIKLDRAIKDAEITIRTFKINAETIQKEIYFLLDSEKQLEENIKYLKNVKIIALAAEYRKAKENLKKTKTRLLQLKADKSNIDRVCKDMDIFLQKNKEAYDKLGKQNENNVLHGKFGKSRV